MNKYFYNGLPTYLMSKFCAVRDSLDNFSNMLTVAEIVNTSHHCLVGNEGNVEFNVAVFTGDYRRILIRKNGGYFSMAIPFQVVTQGDQLSFNSDALGEAVSGRFIAIMRNCIQTTKENSISHEDVIYSLMENFNLSMSDAMRYFDAFASFISEDHGYFRFDDDPINEDGDFHPRFHFDFFYKNTSAVKIGYDRLAQLSCIYSLVDSSIPKKYLTNR